MSVYSEPIEWVEQTIDSVLFQTFVDFEYIIIHDNPDNKTIFNYLTKKAKTDKRIRVIQNDVNIGLTKSLNVGISLAAGKYIARIDADDIWRKSKLEKQVAYLDMNKEIDVCGCSVDYIDERGNYIQHMDFPHTHIDIGCAMVRTNPLVHSSVLLRKSAIVKRAPFYYDESYRTTQDYALWAALYSEGYRFTNLPERLLKYRISSNQTTKKKRAEQLQNAENAKKILLSKISKKLEIKNVFDLEDKELISIFKNLGKSENKLILSHYLYFRIIDKTISRKERILKLLQSRLFLYVSLKKTIKLILR